MLRYFLFKSQRVNNIVSALETAGLGLFKQFMKRPFVQCPVTHYFSVISIWGRRAT
jgi:hypothetical protein